VDVAVKLHGDLTTIAGTYIRVALVENNITYGGHSYYNRILRDMYPNVTGTALTIQNTDQEQVVHLPFTVDPTWNASELLLIAWVQRDSDKFIYNSSNSSVAPNLVAVAVDGAQQAVADGNNPIVFGTAEVTNVGTESDVYTLTLDASELPAGWTATITHDGVEGTTATFGLDSFESTTFFATVVATGSGSGRITVDVYSEAAGEVLESVPFLAIGSGANVLLVADDGAATYAETYVLPTIVADNRAVAVWDRAFSTVDSGALSLFDAVVWVCGLENRGIEAVDRAAIDTYLAAGGRMLVTGQDVAADMAYEGGTAYIWFKAKTHCKFLSNNANNWAISGVAGDPIGDGLSFAIEGGDGANNQSDPDRLDLNDTIAMPVFRYGTGSLAGGRVEVDGYKFVTLGFGLEAIATQEMRDEVMATSLEWLIGPAGSTPVENETPRVLTLAANTPNPFNPSTRIAFALDRSGPVRLEVYDLQGRLVRTLASEPMTAGDHTVVWDGRANDGQPAASGAYVYRLTANDQTLSRKMTLLK
jgi:hypothetical protein